MLFKKLLSRVFVFSFLLMIFAGCKKSNIPTLQPFKSTDVFNDSTILFTPPANLYPISGDTYEFGGICVDNQNNVWISATKGILKFSGGIWTFFNTDDANAKFSLFYFGQIFSDQAGTIYAEGAAIGPASPDNDYSFFVYKNNLWKSYRLPYSPFLIRVDQVTGLLYLCSAASGRDGVYEYKGTGSYSDSSSYQFLDLGGNYIITDMNIYNNNLNLAINQAANRTFSTDSNKYGIISYPSNGSWSLTNYPDSSLLLQFSDLNTSDGKNLVMQGITNWWEMIQTLNPYLYYFDGKSFTSVAMPNVLINGNMQTFSPASLRYSNDGILWIQNNLSGLLKFTLQGYTYYDLQLDKYVRYGAIGDFAIDKNNVKWIISSNIGLIEFTAK